MIGFSQDAIQSERIGLLRARIFYMTPSSLQSNGCSATQVIATGRKAVQRYLGRTSRGVYLFLLCWILLCYSIIFNNSPRPQQICTTILSRVDPRGAVTTLDGRVQNVPPSDSVAAQPSQPGGEPAVAWQQIQRFETMTLREQQDFLEEQDEESEETVMESGGGPSRPAQQGVKVEPLSSVAFHHQLLPFIAQLQPSQPQKPHWAPRGARAGAAYNPNFRGGRAMTSTFTARAAAAETEEAVRRKYPDPAAAKPYLKVMHPTFDELRRERRKEEERLGDSSGLLWRYWMGGRKRSGGTEAVGEEEGEVGDEDEDEDDDEDDEELVPSVVKVEVGADGRKVRRRVRKEFDGRMPVEERAEEVREEEGRKGRREGGWKGREKWKGKGRKGRNGK